MEAIFVITLFALYLILWWVKQARLVRTSGIDPRVMEKSSSNIQLYFARFTKFLSIYAVIVIALHAFNYQIGSLFTRIDELANVGIDILGFLTGLAGLSICLYAQLKMGTSWRVGIDEQVKTSLVTTGLYAVIRNPTYLGLFLMNVGLWLIWPTWAMFIFNLLFIIFLEIQVRCEEDFLTGVHGEDYLSYKRRTKRYIPFIY